MVHLVRPTSWKHQPIILNSNGPLSFCSCKGQVKVFDLKSGSVYARKYSAPNLAWLDAALTCNLLNSFLEGNLDTIGLFQAFFDQIVPLAPKDFQRVYQLNWGVFCTLIRSDIVMFFTCFALNYVWVLIAYLLDCAGIWTSANDDYYSDERSSRWADWLLEWC